ncbi:MAG: type II toxin-antitoxin system RelE/ParE family toxin [Acidocella sp.]|jgi:putative addiction module killer protein|nr:type II toxin-antitoxin system RelE/ParE family toxin [Acidocella sp.]
MIEVRTTETFDVWLKGLRDQAAKAKIAARIQRVEDGNFGDAKFFDGIGELRFTYGPGYRVYFVQRGRIVVILLCGGDKSSQPRNIKLALQMAKEV